MYSCDISSLYTSTPTELAIEVISYLVTQETTINSPTVNK